MKRLSGYVADRSGESVRFEGDEILVELEHGRTVRVVRAAPHGSDGIELSAGLNRANRTHAGAFVVRVVNYGCIDLSIEQARHAVPPKE